MHDLQASMLGAVFAGEGIEGIAQLAASEAGGPVAIVLPARGVSAAAPSGGASPELVDYVAATTAGRRASRPEAVEIELPVIAGSERVGSILALASNGAGPRQKIAVDREVVLRSAAVATLAEVAAADARDELARELRGGLLEDLRANRVSGEEAIRRAARAGCDLSAGAVAVVADVETKPRYAAALIASSCQGTIAEVLDGGRVYALLPNAVGSERAIAIARSVVERLRDYGPAAFSSSCPRVDELHRAISEAELALEVISRDGRMAEQLADGIGGGVYRLLFRALASNPEEVRSFYLDTVAPLVEHDSHYRTDLLATLDAYLANDCSMNAAGRVVFAHRHTIAHRLQRVRELTGLDPSRGEDRERLGLGIKAYRILGPTLPR
jgi:sugar diacid utilization regulator